MTISTDSSAPLVVVVGSTGAQGGSVIRNLIESDKPYRLRGLTRDATKPAAEKLKELGVEVVSVNISVGNEAAVREALKGAEVVFAVTNFWEHTIKSREVAEGKLMVDAAKAVGAKLFVWSGLESVTRNTGGKYTHVHHFDGKAEITEYARSQLPTVDVQAGLYVALPSRRHVPPTQARGRIVCVGQPHGGGRHALAVHRHRTGLRPLRALRHREPSIPHGYQRQVDLHLWRTPHSRSGCRDLMGTVRGIKLTIEPTSVETYLEKAKAAGMPPHVIEDFKDFRYGIQYGYYAGKETSAEQQEIRKGLARQPRTFEEFLRENPAFFRD